MNVKQKKQEEIWLLAQPKLKSIQDIISKALTDSRVLDLQFELILRELERYRTLKQKLRHEAKKKTEAITDDQRETILQQGQEECRNAFLKQLSNTSTIVSPNAT